LNHQVPALRHHRTGAAPSTGVATIPAMALWIARLPPGQDEIDTFRPHARCLA
jgi:hypothetical protein